MRWPLILLCLFVVAASIGAWEIFGLIRASDALSTETGIWAVGLRVLELLFLAITAASILLLFEQMSMTARWNRRLSYHSYFSELPGMEKSKALNGLAKEMGIDALSTGDSISEETAKLLIENDEKRYVVAAYLNDFEEFAGAIRRGLVEEDYAYDLEHVRVVRAWTVFSPFVVRLRRFSINTDCYSEIENLATAWLSKQSKDAKKSKKPKKA